MSGRMRFFIRRDSGATDPLLVIAAIAVTLVLLVGGSLTVAHVTDNAKDLNAQTDLRRVAEAENAWNGAHGTFVSYDDGSHPSTPPGTSGSPRAA